MKKMLHRPSPLRSGTIFTWLATTILLLCSATRATTLVYDVDAWIDTTDYLYIHGATLQWEHNISGSPAGTHLGAEPTILNSTINGVSTMTDVDWDQTWPSPLPADAFSSTFSPLRPTLPLSGDLSVSVLKLSGRGTPTIFQDPTPANDETLIVQFTDGFNGAQYLDAQITVTVPEPSSIALATFAPAACLLRRRR